MEISYKEIMKTKFIPVIDVKQLEYDLNGLKLIESHFSSLKQRYSSYIDDKFFAKAEKIEELRKKLSKSPL